MPTMGVKLKQIELVDLKNSPAAWAFIEGGDESR